MATPRKRLPSSFYFSSQYKSPFHRNEDRISQIDFRTFDPFVPESRQTVANCKKHRRQRHELSDKCKHVLAIVDAQERLLSTRPEVQQFAGYSAQGGQMRKPEISVEFGDGIPEIAKEYVKFWIEQSGMVKEPFSRQYDVHTIQDEHNHPEKPSIVLMAPFEDVDTIDENKVAAVIRTFFEKPKEFSMRHKVGNLRLYGTDKKSRMEDALGYANHLPIKIIGREIITKNLRKANVAPEHYEPMTSEEESRHVHDRAERYYEIFSNRLKAAKELKEEIDALKKEPESQVSDKQKRRIKDKENRYQKLLEEANALGDRAAAFEEESRGIIDNKELAEAKLQLKRELREKEEEDKEKEYRTKQRRILRDMFSPEKNIAPNRLGEGTNPVGYALQAAETPWRAVSNIVQNAAAWKKGKVEREREKDLARKRGEIEAAEEKIQRRQKLKPMEPEFSEKKGPREAPAETPGTEPTKFTSRNIMQDEQKEVIQEELPMDTSVPFSSKKRSMTKSEKYLNSSELIIIAKLKKGGIK